MVPLRHTTQSALEGSVNGATKTHNTVGAGGECEWYHNTVGAGGECEWCHRDTQHSRRWRGV
eukprot:9482248-Pyramimonas_sp.AAC.1